jgi:hypothetical protein
MSKTLNTTTAKVADKPAVIEPKKIDLNKPVIKEAITKAKAVIAEGKSKVDAAMIIYQLLNAEEKEVIIASFVQGATLTEKGAVTYFYNCRRKFKKLQKGT